MTLLIGCPAETAQRETRVALTPSGAERLRRTGLDVVVEAGAGRPAKVLVLGGGVAGLQAIGTARRLGAVVTGYDVREAARADIASTGASVLEDEVTAALLDGQDGQVVHPKGTLS